ncbi:MAG: TMEM175 family protein [Myxococcales bacterium]
MSKGRLEAFSDGVIAVVITIMVLDIHRPAGPTLRELGALWPALASYALSFAYVGIYWNNHHHLLHAARRVNGKVLWANLHLLFWLSLAPLATDWLGASGWAPLPTAAFGALYFVDALAFVLLSRLLLACDPTNETLSAAVNGNATKGIASQLLYVLAVGLAFVRPWIADAIYALVAVLWVVPDPRIERLLSAREAPPGA